MGEEERRYFLAWYKSHKSKDPIFDNTRVLEPYCQDDVTVLRQPCRVFKGELKQIGTLELFLDSITNASACNNLLHKRFLQLQTIRLIPNGEYTFNNNYSKKALNWLLHTEQIDEVKKMHGHNGRDYKVPELPASV